MNIVPDVVVIPVGGGGLAAGNIVSLRHLYGNTVRVVLAEPAVLDDAHRSFRAGERLNHDPSNQLLSVADGLKTTLGPHTWPIIRDLADDVMTVSERDILVATKLVWERLKVVIEPSAGVGVAVVLSNEFATKYVSAQNVAVVLCGGNVDVIKIAGLMAEMAL
jgi:serine racemase